ncbi:O-antigen ligase family protein [Candidatus Saccharibacteria bacterium]|nr:O-antigen ligase family protein [Candidatus Saccharibacteria bacterium]
MTGKLKLILTELKAFRRLSLLERLWLMAPIMIWFSYLPQISLAEDGTMNYELSLTLIYVVTLAIVGLPRVWHHRSELRQSRPIWLASAFVGWSGLCVIWSDNHTRGLLTFAVYAVLYLAFLALVTERRLLCQLLPKLVRVAIRATVLACLLAIVQIILGTFVVTNRHTLGLCAGCVAGQFGFIRPNLLAIEPQFLGSLLLAPLLYITYLTLREKHDYAKQPLLLVLMLTTLWLTLSRGAIYAYLASLVVMILLVRKWRRMLAVVGSVALSLVICLVCQGALAGANPRIDSSFTQAVSTSLNHLSMGIIRLPYQRKSPTSLPSISREHDKQPAYHGYVAESTNVRLSLTKTALAAWRSNRLGQQLFGTGLGSAGIVLARQTGSQYQKEIVQNEFVEVLLERGLVGLALLGGLVVLYGRLCFQRRDHLALTILVAYLTQWCFFSGLPNALHIYLVLALLSVKLLDSASASKDLPDGLK